MKTPANLKTLNEMLQENGIPVTEYNGKYILVNEKKIMFDSTRDSWVLYGDEIKILDTKELVGILKNKKKTRELIYA
jgi:hypothetical protein